MCACVCVFARVYRSACHTDLTFWKALSSCKPSKQAQLFIQSLLKDTKLQPPALAGSSLEYHVTQEREFKQNASGVRPRPPPLGQDRFCWPSCTRCNQKNNTAVLKMSDWSSSYSTGYTFFFFFGQSWSKFTETLVYCSNLRINRATGNIWIKRTAIPLSSTLKSLINEGF